MGCLLGSFEIDGVAGIILSVFQAKERRPVVLAEEEKQKLQMNNQIFLLYFGGDVEEVCVCY